MGASSGATAATAAAAIAQAVKASGSIVRLEPSEFTKILLRVDKPLVVTAKGGMFTAVYQYLTSYKGLVFFTKSREQLRLDGRIEVVEAEKIWVPS